MAILCFEFRKASDSEDSDDNNDDLFVNTNRPPPIEVYDSDSSDADDLQATT